MSSFTRLVALITMVESQPNGTDVLLDGTLWRKHSDQLWVRVGLGHGYTPGPISSKTLALSMANSEWVMM